MIVIAHRGANKEDLENSRAAFDKALAGGATRLELDVRLTADGQLAVLHDDNPVRVTGQNLSVATMDRSAMAGLRLRNGEPIPFLDEILDEYLTKVEINIEIKSTGTAAARKVAQICAGRDVDRIIVSSFRPAPLKYLADHHPEIPVACLFERGFRWPWLSYISPVIFMNRCRSRIIHPAAPLVTRGFMDFCRSRRYLVYPWVSMDGEEQNREALWTWLKTLGVDGLCTNYPRQLQQWLTELKEDEQRFTPHGP